MFGKLKEYSWPAKIHYCLNPCDSCSWSQNKRHIKRTKDNPGGIVSIESPIHYSNVALVDPVTNAPVRVSWRYLEDGSKVRITKGKLASGSIIHRPEILKQRRKPRPVGEGPQDTPVVAALEVSHKLGDLPSALKEMLSDLTLDSNSMDRTRQQTE